MHCKSPVWLYLTKNGRLNFGHNKGYFNFNSIRDCTLCNCQNNGAQAGRTARFFLIMSAELQSVQLIILKQRGEVRRAVPDIYIVYIALIVSPSGIGETKTPFVFFESSSFALDKASGFSNRSIAVIAMIFPARNSPL